MEFKVNDSWWCQKPSKKELEFYNKALARGIKLRLDFRDYSPDMCTVSFLPDLAAMDIGDCKTIADVNAIQSDAMDSLQTHKKAILKVLMHKYFEEIYGKQ